jgi:peptide/nickel transport system ATP-binding protein
MSLSIDRLSVLYHDGLHSIQALDEVSLELKPGVCLALIGESGSGKTTLGHACLGLLPQNASVEGRIRLNGQQIDYSDETSLNQLRWKKLAMVFQNGAANLNPVYRIINQVAEPLIQRADIGRTEAMLAAAQALSELGLNHDECNRFPHQLSGGQVQRALLAMALILDPEVLILDEPTSGLDAVTKTIVADVIQKARSGNKTVFLITHDLEFAVHNSDTITMLYLGQVMETLPAEDLLTSPLHPFTLALSRSYPAMSTARDLGGIRGDAFYRTVHQHGRQEGEIYKHSHIQSPGSGHESSHAPPTGCLFQNRCTQALDCCRTEPVALGVVGDHQVRCLRHGIVSILELKQVEKSYGNVVALRPTDLTIKAGEVFSIVGETGSGKTTLAMTAAGALKPDNGTRVFDAHDMDEWIRRDYKSLARQIGVIYQSPAESISHRFTVLEAVAEPLKIHGLYRNNAERLERVIKVLAHVHLSTDKAFLGRYPHELNMGALQRVSMARALVLNPSLLIADEPTSSLDPSVQAKVLKLLLDLQIELGLSMLFVTHDIGLARKISDRLGVMLQGRLIEFGPASLVIDQPSHPYTRLLIDSVSGLSQKSFNSGSGRVEPGGCPFEPRCPRAKDVCKNKNPQMLERDHRSVTCHFPLGEKK